MHIDNADEEIITNPKDHNTSGKFGVNNNIYIVNIFVVSIFRKI